MPWRSVPGTKTFLIFDFTDFSVIKGWNTVNDFGKRILGLAAFIVVVSAMFPLWSPGQTALDYRLMQHEVEIAALQATVKDMPSQIAVINQRLEDQTVRLNKVSDSIDRIQVFSFTATLGVLAFIGSYLFNIFGGKTFGKRRDTQSG